MKFRNNSMQVIVGAVCLLILAAELCWLIIGGLGYAAARGRLAANLSRLERLERRSPYPSAANLKVLEENLDVLEYQVGELYAAVSRGPAPRGHVESAELSARIQAEVERFRRRAEEAGVLLPDTLEAGFSEYASGGAVAAPRNAPRLMRQLHSVSALTDVLIDSGVQSIGSITRDRFERESGPDLVRRRSVNARQAGDERPPASQVGPGGLYLIERIGVEFSAYEDGVWRVLEGLASSPRFMTVSEFSHTTDGRVHDYSPQAVKRGVETDDETLAFLREGVLRGDQALPRPERIIAGTDRVRVRMMVDVYNFNREISDDRTR